MTEQAQRRQKHLPKFPRVIWSIFHQFSFEKFCEATSHSSRSYALVYLKDGVYIMECFFSWLLPRFFMVGLAACVFKQKI